MSQLPFDPTQPAYQRYAYQPDQPPVLPPFHPLAQEINAIYPLFVSALITVIQNTADQNPLRMFMFNQMASNGWKNQDFLDFVQQSSIYFSRALASGATPRNNDSISQIAGTVAAIRAAKNAELYQGLRSYIDPNLVPDIQRASKAWTSLVNDNKPKQQNEWGQPKQQNEWGLPDTRTQTQNRQYPNGDSWNVQSNPGGWRDSPRNASPSVAPSPLSRGSWIGADADPLPITRRAPIQAPIQTSNYDAGAWRNEGTQLAKPEWAMDTPAPVVAPVTKPVIVAKNTYVPIIEAIESNVYTNDVIKHRYDDVIIETKVPVVAPAPVVPKQPVTPVATTPVTETTDFTSLKHWKTTKFVPSARWFSTIAFNPNTHDLFYRIHPDGSMQPVIAQKETSDMDYAKHVGELTYAPTAPIGVKRLDIDTRQDKLIEQLNDKDNELNAVVVLNVVALNRSWITTEKENIWLYNQIRMNGLKNTKGPRAVRQGGNILSKVVTTKRLVNFIQYLKDKLAVTSTGTTLTQPLICLAQQLASTGKKLDDGIDVDVDAIGLNAINRRLTAFVNNTLREEFGRRGGTIDSFVEDVNDLLEYLQATSETIYRRFLTLQDDIINRSLQVLTGVLASEEDEEVIADLDLPDDLKNDVDFFITHFYEQTSFTSIDIYAKELGSDFENNDHSVLVIEKYTPVLYALCENIFKYNAACDNFFTRHYLRTADNVTLVVSLSPTGGSNYMVGLVK